MNKNWKIVSWYCGRPYEMQYLPTGEYVNWCSIRYWTLKALEWQKVYNWKRKPYQLRTDYFGLKQLWIHGPDRKWFPAVGFNH